ncbi:hypothetical protein BKA58DRAFT_388320 [Alternaria rosae]|uniref:uncharacterized protein n=1 Tax=Alternaria rosae TaxID=1187941 RepID=UPI001E8DF90A|nr:uncharacterized protein BKA58DRAFT_388320 [Alternaria rosae]KAH6866618.1 hypothetical protein BKA58DRAFT_388320 [Alternaria rosae]
MSTAYTCLSQDADCSATKLRTLKGMNEDFAFEIMVVQNQRLKNLESSDHMPLELEDAVPNSCILHEHLVQDARQCRKRIRDQPYILTGLIEMCVQDAVSMAKEFDED